MITFDTCVATKADNVDHLCDIYQLEKHGLLDLWVRIGPALVNMQYYQRRTVQ